MHADCLRTEADMNPYFIIVCESTNQMLKANKLINAQGISTVLIPTTIEYGSACSTAIRINRADHNTVKEILDHNQIALAGIYPYQTKKLDGLLARLQQPEISAEFQAVLQKIQNGEELTVDEVTILLTTTNKAETTALFSAADRMRRETVGDVVEIRGAIEFSNYCRKNCNYCGIRANNNQIMRYRMTEAEIIEQVILMRSLGLKTVILQSGEDPWYTPEKIIGLIKEIKGKTGMRISLSIGERDYAEYKLYKAAGTDNFLLKIETVNADLFRELHPDDDFATRLEHMRWLKELGYITGSGNIIGLPGQTPRDIASDIIYMRDAGIHMVGIGPFIPAGNTPLATGQAGDLNLTLKTIATTRVVLKNVFIPSTTALATLDNDALKAGLKVGGNVIMINMTPAKYQTLYNIYDQKEVITLEQTVSLVKALGRKLPVYLR